MPWRIGATLFTNRHEAWAIGITGPTPGVDGMGFRVLLHTVDGGHTWAEVPKTQSYSVPPSVAFLNDKVGWVQTIDDSTGEQNLFETVNGGQSWTAATGAFPVFPRILDGSHWWGLKPRLAMSATAGSYLERTSDGGRSWRNTRLPDALGDFPIVKFISPDVGWAGNINGTQLVVFRTVDGGRTWEESVTSAPNGTTHLVDLRFLDSRRGWLILNYSIHDGLNGERSKMFATLDGGRTWIERLTAAIESGPVLWINFLSEQLGLAFVDEAVAASSRGDNRGESSPTIVYFANAGTEWHKLTIPYEVVGCQTVGEDLLCSAYGRRSSLMLVTIHPR